MNKNQKGFTALIVVAIVLLVGSIGGVGYYVYQRQSNHQSLLPWSKETTLPDYNCNENACAAKPIIYLYPPKNQEVKVRLDYSGTLTATYPDYDYHKKGWDVIASPDGSLINKSDSKPYSYIFWEGKSENIEYDLSSGFIIKGTDTKDFLQSTLAKLGLTSKEYNEMIVYWLPKMQNNKYNLIHFAGKQYTDSARLIISPKPDSMLRVFMVYKALDKPLSIKPQNIKPFERKGFVVIEWGGTEIK